MLDCQPSLAGIAAPSAPHVGVMEPTADPSTRPLNEEDLLEFEWAADPQISPDGSHIVFTRVRVDATADEYRTSLWILDAAGGPPRPLTSGERDSQPRWSPDGRCLAFVRGTESKKPGQIFLLPMTGGEAIALTSLEGGASAPAWSPDSKLIAFLSTTNPALDDPKNEKPKHEPGRIVTRPMFRMNNEGWIEWDHLNHLWVVDTVGGKPRQLTHGEFAEAAPRWSRDGKWIFFTSDRRKQPWFGPSQSDLYAVSEALASPSNGAELKLIVHAGGEIAAYAEATNGDIALIAAVAKDPPRSHDQPDLLLASGPWPCSAPRNLTAQGDFSIGEGIASDQHPPRGGGEIPLAWSADGRAIVVRVAHHGAALLASVELASGKVTELGDAKHDLICATCTPDGKRWAINLGDPLNPGDLYRFDASTRELKKLWGPNDALLATRELGSMEEIWYPSFDGKMIQGWIVKPPNFDPKRKYPMILEIHGGPHTAYGLGFFHEFQALAGAGYIVLYTNPRGSTSYGQEFANIIQYRYPGDDYLDLMAGVDELLKRGYVDPKRLGVTGGSGGGLLTNWVITQTDRFAAAITQRCVSEWESFWYSCDFTMFTPSWFRKSPFEDAEEYRLRSPVAYVEKIETPLMVIHSEEDWRTPIGQGEAMFRALKQQKKVTVMIRFPGENHELSRSGTPSRRVQNQHHIRQWFDRWLLGKPAPEYDE